MKIVLYIYTFSPQPAVHRSLYSW